MDFETVKKIYAAIECTEFVSLKEDLIRSAVRYARKRTDWFLSHHEDRREMDGARTHCPQHPH